jgi:hypothetical protein
VKSVSAANAGGCNDDITNTSDNAQRPVIAGSSGSVSGVLTWNPL